MASVFQNYCWARSIETSAEGINHNSERAKRAVIFRPLFVYRKEQIEKQRLNEERERRRQSAENEIQRQDPPPQQQSTNCQCPEQYPYYQNPYY